MTTTHDDVAVFLAHACKLEEDAAQRFSDLAEAMKTYGNTDIADFFGKMAHFSRLHMTEARERSGFRDIPKLEDHEFQWPDGESPESTSMEGSHYLMTAEYALELALESERRGFLYYANMSKESPDPEVRMMAEEFAAEEAEHVSELEAWSARYQRKS